MKATLEYVEQKFQEFNEQMFEGSLPKPPFKLSNSRTALGQITFFREKTADGDWHYYGFTFRVSTMAELPEQEVEDTIIHEMIHYYILSNQMQDTAPHGEIFTRMMKDLNQRFNRNITVSHTMTKEEADSDTEIREHLICVATLTGNNKAIAISTRSRIIQVWDEMEKFPNVKEFKWYVSKDPFFNRFHRVTTAKLSIIQAAVLEEHLKDARQLIRTGRYIRLAK